MKKRVKKGEGFGMSLDRDGNAYRLCVLEDMNGRIRDRVRASITDASSSRRGR